MIAITFITVLHTAIAAILILIINHWFVYVLCALSVLYSFYKTVRGIRDHSESFKKYADFMQRVYDKTVGRLMKIWALHYPVNKMPEPENKISVPLNTPSGEINIISIEVNENENTPPEIEEKNNIQNGNNNIEGNNHQN